MGHMSDLRFGARALGNILVRSDPAAIQHRLIDNRYGPAIAERRSDRNHLFLSQTRRKVEYIFIDVRCKVSRVLPQLEYRFEVTAYPDLVSRHLVHFDIFAVANNQPLISVEHAQALRHMTQSRIKPSILLVELLLSHFGFCDLDPNADIAAIVGAEMLVPKPSAIGHSVFSYCVPQPVHRDAIGEPFLLSSNRIEIMAGCDAGTDHFFPFQTNDTKMSCVWKHLVLMLVPKYQAIIRIEDNKASWHRVDDGQQSLMGALPLDLGLPQVANILMCCNPAAVTDGMP